MNGGKRSRRVAAGLLLIAAVTMTSAATRFARDPFALLRFARVAMIRMAGGEFLGDDGVVLQRTVYDCGPAALANLVQLLGITPPPLDSLSTLAGTTSRGTSFAALRRAASLLGVSLEASRFVPPTVPESRLPLIAWFGRRHFVVVAGRSPKGMLTVLDPQMGRYRAPERWFAKQWSGEALLKPGHQSRISAQPIARSDIQ
jgi:ABC-type bacteriocin/lantibiotic exporter with double-glycine peptidase domain